MSKFRIFCEVSGGCTGYRCGYFKVNGKEAVFADHDEAMIEANKLTAHMNRPGAVATFCYTVEDYLTGDELLATHRYTGQEALDLD